MSTRSSIRPARAPAPALLVLMTLVFVACTGTAASPPSSQDPASPSDPAPVPTATLGPVINTDALLADVGAMDGQRVRVDGFLLAIGDQAQLCSVVMESYPPQCGGAMVRVTGAIPAEVAAGLDQVNEPGLAPAAWGWVIVTGTFQASGADGRPTLAIEHIELHEG